MNAISPALIAETTCDPFAAATKRMNEWRGRCLAIFARAELAVTKCLVAMAAVPGKGDAVRLPHLVGQRFEALAGAIAAGGPFATGGDKLQTSIDQFRGHAAFRALLSHGSCDVLLDRRGGCTFVLHMLCLRNRSAETERLFLSEAEAECLRLEISRCGNHLCSHVTRFQVQLATNTPADPSAP